MQTPYQIAAGKEGPLPCANPVNTQSILKAGVFLCLGRSGTAVGRKHKGAVVWNYVTLHLLSDRPAE